MESLLFTSEEIDINPCAYWGELLQIAFVNKEQYFSISRLAYEEIQLPSFSVDLEEVLQELKKKVR